jgi:hypothetical protein
VKLLPENQLSPTNSLKAFYARFMIVEHYNVVELFASLGDGTLIICAFPAAGFEESMLRSAGPGLDFSCRPHPPRPGCSTATFGISLITVY